MSKKTTTKKKTKSTRKKTAKGKTTPKKTRKKSSKTTRKTTARKKAPKRKSKRKTTSRSKTAKKTRTTRRVSRKKPVKPAVLTDEVQERIDYVRSLKGEDARVEELSSILVETMDRVHLKALSIAAVEELGKTNHAKAIEVLSFAWNNCRNVDTRSAMVRALANFPHKEVLRPLERIALSNSIGVELRLQAVEALSQHRTNASWTALGRVLKEASETGEKPLQGAAIEALRRNNGKAVSPLLKALDSEDEEEQVSAATALGVTGDKKALDTLRGLSDSAESAALKEAATRAAILLYCS